MGPLHGLSPASFVLRPPLLAPSVRVRALRLLAEEGVVTGRQDPINADPAVVAANRARLIAAMRGAGPLNALLADALETVHSPSPVPTTTHTARRPPVTELEVPRYPESYVRALREDMQQWKRLAQQQRERAAQAEAERDEWHRLADVATATMHKHSDRLLAAESEVAMLRRADEQNELIGAALARVRALCDKWDPQDIRGIFNRIAVHEVRAAIDGEAGK